MEQCEKAIMETDQTSREGQVKGTNPNILDDLLKRAQSVQQRFADAPLRICNQGDRSHISERASKRDVPDDLPKSAQSAQQ